MINQKNKSKSRVGCFGASDTHFIMGNWDTLTFMNWWQSKLGVKNISFMNKYTVAGTYIEHRIADYYSTTHNIKLKLDRRVKVNKERLVVNLDAETKDEILEIKTHRLTDKDWKMPEAYWQQVQVQMWATNKHLGSILAYGLTDEDYDNFYLPIDPKRFEIIKIDYDNDWVLNKYLPRERYLATCLKKGKTPSEKEFKEINNNV